MDLRFERAAQKADEALRIPTDPERLIPWLDRKREAGRPRIPESQLKLNLAYVLGEQHLVWDGDRRAYRRVVTRRNDPNALPRVTANKVGSIVEHYIARLHKSNQEPEARPVTDDDDDVSAARVATRILHSEMDRLHWKDGLAIDLLFWVVTLGWSYLQIAWDPHAGAEIARDTDGRPIHEGAVMLDVVPGFEMSIDPNSKRRDLTDAWWGVRTVTMTPEAVYQVYGRWADAETGRSLADEVYDLYNPSASEDRRGEMVKVHQMWVRPGFGDNPEGLVVTWSGKTILQDPIPFPYHHGRLPWIQFDLLPGLGTREGRTWVKDLIPLQADYNDARSREAAIRRTLTPKILYPTGSIDPNRVTSRVELIGYHPVGERPSVMIPDSGWIAQYEAAMSRADAEMGERAGQTDVSSGHASPSMPAAAILALQEADDTKLAIPARLFANGTAQMGWHILELVRQFWTEERIVRTWSQDGDLEVERFSGAEISQQLDIRVQSESSLPRSKAARTQLAMELWTQGIITDPRTYIRMLDLPGTDFITHSLSLDAKRAQRENADLAKGIQRQVELWDNHVVHLTEHNDFRKSEEYEQFTPEQKAVFDAHCAVHEELVLGQLGTPAPPGTEFDPEAVAQAGTGALGRVQYLDKLTGRPPDSLMAASGLGPSALSEGQINRAAGIGGPGQQGAVPGISADIQAAQTGN